MGFHMQFLVHASCIYGSQNINLIPQFYDELLGQPNYKQIFAKLTQIKVHFTMLVHISNFKVGLRN